jgi:putative DNA primase/helicase
MSNRFTRKNPCLICGGHDGIERGKGRRCHGFLSSVGSYANCSREEHAGTLPKNAKSDTYGHKLEGDCKCGVRHDPLPEAPRKRIVAEYDYTDERGELLYQVVRFEPKDFRQRRPDGRGGWAWNLNGVRRVPYRLPQLLESNQQTTVFIVEGEKDADRLASLGLVATTNASGAGKWRSEYNEHLPGRHVCILPDNDEPGRSHARMVATSLKGQAASVKVVELPSLPDKGDVSGWLDAGGTVEQLRALIEGATSDHSATQHQSDPHPVTASEAVTVRCLANVQSETIEWLWHPYIALGKLTIFEGDGGVGKSFATCALATAVSRGYGLPNVEPSEPRNVLMLSAEDGLGDTLRPRLDSMNADVNRIYAVDGALVFNKAGLDKLEGYLSEYRPAVVIIDPLFAYTGAGMDVYRDNEVRGLMTPLKMLAENYGCAIIAIRHLTKSATKAGYAGSGSVAFGASVRSVLLFGRDSEGNCGFVQTKNNLAPMGEAVGYTIEDGCFMWLDRCALTADKILALPMPEKRSKVEVAEDFLADLLNGGALDSKEVERLATAEGIASRTLERAKGNLGVKSEKRGSKWLCYLLGEDRQIQLGGVGGLEQSERETEGKNVTPPKHLHADASEMKNAAKGVSGRLGGVAGAPSEKDVAYQERAAILEHDGGMTRQGAEFHAQFIRPEDIKPVPLLDNGIRIKPKHKPLAERALPTSERRVVPVEYADGMRVGDDGVLRDAAGEPLF